MGIPSRLRKMIATAAFGAAAFTVTTETASAFFPPLPSGGGPVTVTPQPPAPVVIPVSPTIPVVPIFPPPPVVPPVPPPPFLPPPPPPPPPTDPQGGHDCPTPPQAVPEPATFVSGLIGLSVLGGYAWRRWRSERTN